MLGGAKRYNNHNNITRNKDHIVNRLIRINIINIKNKFGTTLRRWVREHTFLKQRFVGRPVGGTLDATETDLTVTQLRMVFKNTGGLRRVQAPLKIAPSMSQVIAKSMASLTHSWAIFRIGSSSAFSTAMSLMASESSSLSIWLTLRFEFLMTS